MERRQVSLQSSSRGSRRIVENCYCIQHSYKTSVFIILLLSEAITSVNNVFRLSVVIGLVALDINVSGHPFTQLSVFRCWHKPNSHNID